MSDVELWIYGKRTLPLKDCLIEETFPLLPEELQAAICVLSLVRVFQGAQEKKSPHFQWNTLGILDRMPPRVCFQLQRTRDMAGHAGPSPSSTLRKVMMAFKGQDYENPVNDGFFYCILTSALENDFFFFFFKSLRLCCSPKMQAESHSSLYSCKNGASMWKRKSPSVQLFRGISSIHRAGFGLCFFPLQRSFRQAVSCVTGRSGCAGPCRNLWGRSGLGLVCLFIHLWRKRRCVLRCLHEILSALLPCFMIFHLVQESWHKQGVYITTA